MSWPEDPRWSALFAPIAPSVRRVEASLGLDRSVRVVDVATGAPDELVLSEGAEEELPEELGGLALDRWRRAAGEVLVASIAGPEADWRVRAEGLEQIDRVAPELGLLWEGLGGWWTSPERGMAERPARAAWYVRWARENGGLDWAPSEERWLAFGAWLLDRRGPAAGAPVPLDGSTAPPGPWEAAPLSLRRVRADGGACGLQLRPDGVAGPAVELVGEARTVVYAALHGGPALVRAEPIGPVGVWALRSGRTDLRFGAARGVELTLHADGRGEVTMADAFIGPATEDALEIAAQYSVSGTIEGSWRLVSGGDSVAITLGPVRPVGLTVHPRGRFGFAIPAGAMLGRAEGWLSRIAGTRWAVRPIEDGIEVEGSGLGPTVVLRFARA